MLEITLRPQGDVDIVAVKGRVTGGPEVYGLAKQVQGRLAEGRRLFLFDFSQVSFLGSLGIGVLAQTHAAIVRAGGRDLLLSPRSQAVASLRVNGLVPAVIGVVEDEATGLEQLRASGQAGSGEA